MAPGMKDEVSYPEAGWHQSGEFTRRDSGWLSRKIFNGFPVFPAIGSVVDSAPKRPDGPQEEIDPSALF